MVMDKYPAIRVSEEGIVRFMDHVITEEVIRLYLNNHLIAEQVASPDRLEDLGAGFVICEGLTDRVEGVQVTGNEIWVEADTSGSIELEYRSGGGCGIRRVPKRVASSLTVGPADIFGVTREIESDIWKKTGAVHCSVLASPGGVVTRSCDIGRHNTVDKVVGFAERNGVDRARCFIACTGRQPAGMVAKCANAGIPIVVSRAATTDRGIFTADQTGITLICFSREQRFTVFTHPERIKGIAFRSGEEV